LEILAAVDDQRFVVFQAPPGIVYHDTLTVLSLVTGHDS